MLKVVAKGRRRGDSYFMPNLSYVLTIEAKTFLTVIDKLQMLTNYVGALQKRVGEGKLQYMKSHDFHVLMHRVFLMNYFTISLVAYLRTTCMKQIIWIMVIMSHLIISLVSNLGSIIAAPEWRVPCI